MKLCKIKNCLSRHHGQGYCNKHYLKLVVKPQKEAIKCSLDGCDNNCCMESGKSNLCSKHHHRKKKHGDVGEIEGVRRRFLGNIPSNPSIDYVFTSLVEFSRAVIAYYGNKCKECGWDKDRCDAHHVKPKSKGGLNNIRNGIVLCPNCHRIAHTNLRNKNS